MCVRAIRAEDASLLSQTGWLSHIPVDCQDAVLDECLCYVTNAGQAITHGGEETGGMFGIISGTVGVYSAVGSSEAPLIHIAGPAFWFGLYPITNGRPRIISVTARTPCMIAQLPETALRTLLDRRPEMWRWLNLLSLESSALAVQALADLLISDKDRRCAAVMLRIAGCRENGDAPANASLTQDDLAALSNLSRPTVSLVVRRLAARGFVSPGYKTITINTPAQLRSFVG
jgi:CRP-like cAMP-binding protein